MSRLSNKTVASSITINFTTSINKRPWSWPLLINVCHHTVDTDDESAIQSTMVWLGRRHLAFAVASGVLNRRFSAATVGCCGDGWKLWRVAGEAHNMTENALSIWIVIFSVHLQQTEISERKLFIFHLGRRLEIVQALMLTIAQLTKRHEILSNVKYKPLVKHHKTFVKH